MKPSDITPVLLREAVKNSTSLRSVCRNLDVSWNRLSQLTVKKRILELNIDFSHLKKSKFNSIEKINNAIDKIYNYENNRRRQDRKDPLRRSFYICQDSKKSDNKRGLKGNNLTIEIVKDLIKNGCSYCEEKNLMMTLDRIDNSLAHITKNVRAACIRCNLMRRNMPYKAWIVLAPKIREIRELGLFDNWDGSIHK